MLFDHMFISRLYLRKRREFRDETKTNFFARKLECHTNSQYLKTSTIFWCNSFWGQFALIRKKSALKIK